MSTFTYVPSWGSSVDREPRIFEAQFGDGYAQRVADGINNNPKVWNLTFDRTVKADADAIVAFLVAAGGVTPFDWTDSDGVAGKYVCKTWKRNFGSFGSHVVTATFTQDFSPA